MLSRFNLFSTLGRGISVSHRCLPPLSVISDRSLATKTNMKKKKKQIVEAEVVETKPKEDEAVKEKPLTREDVENMIVNTVSSEASIEVNNVDKTKTDYFHDLFTKFKVLKKCSDELKIPIPSPSLSKIGSVNDLTDFFVNHIQSKAKKEEKVTLPPNLTILNKRIRKKKQKSKTMPENLSSTSKQPPNTTTTT